MSELISEAYADKDSDKEETRALEDYDWIMRGLTARGALAFAEVTWLLEGGFPQGLRPVSGHCTKLPSLRR